MVHYINYISLKVYYREVLDFILDLFSLKKIFAFSQWGETIISKYIIKSSFFRSQIEGRPTFPDHLFPTAILLTAKGIFLPITICPWFTHELSQISHVFF